jgi:Malectin domain
VANPGPYPYHGLVAGNVVYSNQGRGLNINSGQNIDVYNNTTYHNGTDTRALSFCEILLGGSNVNIANNVAIGNTAAPENGTTLCWVGAYGFSEAGTSVFNNNFYNGSGSSGVSVTGTQNNTGNLASITASSAHNLLAVNPLLVSPTTDFHPQSGSPLIGAGTGFPGGGTGIYPNPANVTPDGNPMAASPSNIGAYNTASGGSNTVAGPVSISAGGPAAAPFIADAGFNGGTPAGPYTGAIDTSLVANPAPQSVYQNQRYGSSFNYVISSLTPGKTYQTVLHFTEDWNTAAGQRQENVTINGTQVLSAFDIFAATGAQHKAIAKSFNAAADANGNITISFAGTPGLADVNAKVDGIQVLLSSDWLLSANTPILYCSSVTLGHGCQQAVRTPNFTYWQPSSVAYPQVIRINLQALYNITRIAGTYNAPCLPDKVYVFTSTDLRKPWELVYTSISPSQSSFNVSFPNPQHINVQAGKFVAVMTDGFASGCFKMQTLQVYGH